MSGSVLCGINRASGCMFFEALGYVNLILVGCLIVAQVLC